MTFSIAGIASVSLDGEHVSAQNVISGLEVEKTNQVIRLTFTPCYGLAGEITAEDVTVRPDSGNPAVRVPIIMESVRPGQLDPNVFEVAVLERIAAAHPPLRPHLAHLRVLKREFTAVGSYMTESSTNHRRCQIQVGLRRTFTLCHRVLLSYN
jgi:hypothetical protein